MITAAADSHVAATDDGDCTTEIKCSECGKTVVSGANEHIDNDGDYICDSDCCVVVVPGDPDDGDGSVDLPTIPY